MNIYKMEEINSYLDIDSNNQSLSEQLSYLWNNEIAISKKNSLLYYKQNWSNVENKNNKASNKKDTDQDKLTKEVEKMWINLFYIIEHKEIETEDNVKKDVFILENIENKEYLWMFSYDLNIVNWKKSYKYKIIKSNISRMPFYFKDKEVKLLTTEDKKNWIEKHYNTYSYQIDRVELWIDDFYILYTLQWNVYLRLLWFSWKSDDYNISNLLKNKKKEDLQIKWAWYINNNIPYLTIDNEQDDESKKNYSIWLQPNNLFIYINNDKIKVAEDVIDYTDLKNEVYTISMTQWQYYLYKDWLFLKNFKSYYWYKHYWSYIELFIKEFDDNNINVYKLWQYGKIELLRNEEKKINLYELSKWL